jgi:CheY-like chemotaxis protein
MHILVVEDEEPARRVLIRVLTLAEHTTCWASTGEGALSLLGTESIDLVLLDLNLPLRVSGYEVLGRMRYEPRWRKIPVFVVTGESPEEIAQKTADPLAGATQVFTKPVELALLLGEIAKLRRTQTPCPTRPRRE